jgi:hypothetical protein
MGNEKCLTAAQLIAELSKFPADMPVWTEGCDCYGEAAGVTDMLDGTLMIVRPERVPYD